MYLRRISVNNRTNHRNHHRRTSVGLSPRSKWQRTPLTTMKNQEEMKKEWMRNSNWKKKQLKKEEESKRVFLELHKIAGCTSNKLVHLVAPFPRSWWSPIFNDEISHNHRTSWASSCNYWGYFSYLHPFLQAQEQRLERTNHTFVLKINHNPPHPPSKKKKFININQIQYIRTHEPNLTQLIATIVC